jgi:hypothetical protein
MSAQPHPNSMNPDIERELARRPAGASDPAKALAAVEAVLAVVAFAVLCAVVLSAAPPRGVEPDDGAYRASIVAMTEGNFLTLSGAQVTALTEQLRGQGVPEALSSSRTNGSNCPMGGISARRTPAIRSSRRRSRRSASSGGRRCSTGSWPALGCSSAPGAGSGAAAAWRRWACTAHPERRCCLPGAITCRRSPTPR